MPDATRITVGKNDEATVVAEQLIDADTDTIIFVIPKGAVFSQSLNNFKLLKREGSVLGKEIIIESDDPTVQAKAAKAGLEIGEVVATADDGQTSEDVEVPAVKGGRLPRGRSLRVRSAEAEEEPVARIARVKKKSVPEPEPEPVVDAELPEEADEVSRGEPTRPTRHRTISFWTRGRVTGTVIALVVGLSFVYVAMYILPRAAVAVTTAKDSWKYSGSVIVDKNVAQVDTAGGKIPGQIFTQKSTATVKLPATGRQFIERKASGVITVYNAYSSQPQNIVANTRFVTPNGVVFRITKALTIPGAKIENGSIIPSSVTADVVADKAGEAGNVGPTARLSIPGFAKTPKYQGFYGELKEGASGGFSGTTRVATEADIKVGKANGAQQAEQLVRSQMQGQIPGGFKEIESATRFSITKQTVDQIADADGNFTVVTEAQLSVFAFREQDVRDLVDTLRAAAKADFKIDTEQLTFGTGSGNLLVAGRISLPIEYEAQLSHTLDVDALRVKIAGRPEEELTTLILGTPGITGGTVHLWPFYVGRVPNDEGKIEIVVQ